MSAYHRSAEKSSASFGRRFCAFLDLAIEQTPASSCVSMLTAGRIAGPWWCNGLNQPDVLPAFLARADDEPAADRHEAGEGDAWQCVSGDWRDRMCDERKRH